MKERWGGDAGARKSVRPNLWAARIILHNTCIAFLALGPVSIYREALAAVSRDTRGVSGCCNMFEACSYKGGYLP